MKYLRLFALLAVIGVITSAFPSVSEASHFRFGHVTWKRVQGAPNPRTVEITVTEAWRASAIDGLSYSFGDVGSFSTWSGYTIIATLTDLAGEQYTIKQNKVQHTYANDGPFTVSGSSCCRIFGLVNASSSSEQLTAIVDLRKATRGRRSLPSRSSCRWSRANSTPSPSPSATRMGTPSRSACPRPPNP